MKYSLLNNFIKSLGVASGVIFLLMCFLVTTDVGLRFFNHSLPAATEISENLLVFSVFLSFAYTQAKHSNVAMDFIILKFPSRLQFITSLFNKFVCLIFTVSFFIGTLIEAFKSYGIGEYKASSFDVPLWPSKFVVAFGFMALAVVYIAQIISELNEKKASIVIAKGDI